MNAPNASSEIPENKIGPINLDERLSALPEAVFQNTQGNVWIISYQWNTQFFLSIWDDLFPFSINGGELRSGVEEIDTERNELFLSGVGIVSFDPSNGAISQTSDWRPYRRLGHNSKLGIDIIDVYRIESTPQPLTAFAPARSKETSVNTPCILNNWACYPFTIEEGKELQNITIPVYNRAEIAYNWVSFSYNAEWHVESHNGMLASENQNGIVKLYRVSSSVSDSMSPGWYCLYINGKYLDIKDKRNVINCPSQIKWIVKMDSWYYVHINNALTKEYPNAGDDEYRKINLKTGQVGKARSLSIHENSATITLNWDYINDDISWIRPLENATEEYDALACYKWKAVYYKMTDKKSGQLYTTDDWRLLWPHPQKYNEYDYGLDIEYKINSKSLTAVALRSQQNGHMYTVEGKNAYKDLEVSKWKVYYQGNLVMTDDTNDIVLPNDKWQYYVRESEKIIRVYELNKGSSSQNYSITSQYLVNTNDVHRLIMGWWELPQVLKSHTLTDTADHHWIWAYACLEGSSCSLLVNGTWELIHKTLRWKDYFINPEWEYYAFDGETFVKIVDPILKTDLQNDFVHHISWIRHIVSHDVEGLLKHN